MKRPQNPKAFAAVAWTQTSSSETAGQFSFFNLSTGSMGKSNTTPVTLMDSTMLGSSNFPGGKSPTPSSLADDIFNDPHSWQGADLIEEVAVEEVQIEKEKRSTKREASVFHEIPTTPRRAPSVKREASVFLDSPEKLNRTPSGKRDFKLKPFMGQHKLAPRPIKLSLSGDNMHHWESADDEPRKSIRTPKELSKEIKRVTRLWSHGHLLRPFSSPNKQSPLDAPVSAAGPYSPPAQTVSARVSFYSPKDLSAGMTASATWNILQFYAPHDGPQTAGLPTKPQSARPQIPPMPRFPPPLPSAPLKRKPYPAPPDTDEVPSVAASICANEGETRQSDGASKPGDAVIQVIGFSSYFIIHCRFCSQVG